MTLITPITAMLIAIFRNNKLLISSCMTVQLRYEKMSSVLGMLMASGINVRFLHM